MKLSFNDKGKKISANIDCFPKQLDTLLPPKGTCCDSWERLTQKALDNPLVFKELSNYDLEGKKVCILTDDHARPTPAHRIIPEVLQRIHAAGAVREHITFVTGSGMHDCMNDTQLRNKLGDSTVENYLCISHDGGDRSNLTFVGITPLGSPVWVNRYVAEADFVLVIGRVYPHITYGYEGGYKMITPGVSSFETIMRDHSLNFSEYSVYGNLKKNPSRAEADAMGKLVGVNYLINFVVNSAGEPLNAWAGECDDVFRHCVDFGERSAWGIKVDKEYDISILASGSVLNNGIEENPTYFMGLVQNITKPDGTIIMLLDEQPQSSCYMVDGINIATLSLNDLLLLHEKRTWQHDERQVQHILKTIRACFYEKRIMELHSQKLIIVSQRSFSAKTLYRWRAVQYRNLQQAIDSINLERSMHIAVLPQGRDTYPIRHYSYGSESE